ncbi:MAG: hypothetical protein RL180_349, partial [Pseudomonadota bacterium]
YNWLVIAGVIHRLREMDDLWITAVDKYVDNHGDNFRKKVIPNLSTGNPQVYPQRNLMIKIIKSDLSTEKGVPNNNKFKFINLKFMMSNAKNCG